MLGWDNTNYMKYTNCGMPKCLNVAKNNNILDLVKVNELWFIKNFV